MSKNGEATGRLTLEGAQREDVGSGEQIATTRFGVDESDDEPRDDE